MRKTILWGALGALAMYLFDPQLGRTRRARLSDQLTGVLRRSKREASRKAEYARGHAEGFRHLGSSDQVPENDLALRDKVESEVLSRWSYPKGDINVNVVDGIVELRGSCETTDQIGELEQEVRKVTGVVDVHSYLHLPGTPAPNKWEAINASR